MNAKAAHKTITLLKKLATASDAGAFVDDRIVSAADQLNHVSSEPDRFTAYC